VNSRSAKKALSASDTLPEACLKPMIASPSVNSVIYRFANDVGHALILNSSYRF